MSEMKRVNFNFPVQFIDRIDSLAKHYGYSRTVMIMVMCNEMMKQEQVAYLADHLKGLKSGNDEKIMID